MSNHPKYYGCTLVKLQDESKGNLAKEIQKWLIRVRLENHWSQLDAARNLGVSQTTIVRLESGKLNRLPLDTLLRIAHQVGYEPKITFQRCADNDICDT